MKAVVISGGQPLSKDRALHILKDSDYIICADKGIEYARSYGVEPDLAVGDMDSADSKAVSELDQSRVEVSPAEKDYTDTHIAVMKALEAGASEIDIICATGLRSDHAIANIRLLLLIDEGEVSGRIIDDENIITLCTGETVFMDRAGTTVSIISLSNDTRGITLEGFQYPLKDKDADLGWTTGISNVITGDYARISISSGRLLVFEIL